MMGLSSPYETKVLRDNFRDRETLGTTVDRDEKETSMKLMGKIN